MIVRAHETVQTGWAAFEHNALFTVFSAPDYQGLGNTGLPRFNCQCHALLADSCVSEPADEMLLFSGINQMSRI